MTESDKQSQLLKNRYKYTDEKRWMKIISDLQHRIDMLGSTGHWTGKIYVELEERLLREQMRVVNTKGALYKDLHILDKIITRYDKPALFQTFDDELNGITFSCPICLEEFCVSDIDMEYTHVSAYDTCNHIACDNCIDEIRQRDENYNCPFCRQSSKKVTSIGDVLLYEITEPFCKNVIHGQKEFGEHAYCYETGNLLKLKERILADYDNTYTK